MSPSYNLGRNGDRMRNCVRSRTTQYGAYPGTECFWDGGYFDGWYLSSDQTSSYRHTLRDFMGQY